MRGFSQVVLGDKVAYKYIHRLDLPPSNHEISFATLGVELGVALPFEIEEGPFEVDNGPDGTPPGVTQWGLRLVTPKGQRVSTVTYPKRFRIQVLNMLLRVHDAGLAHRDAHAYNVIVYGHRAWLIDWEFATETEATIPYDLFGPMSGTEPPKPHQQDIGAPVYWAYGSVAALWRWLGGGVPIEVAQRFF